MSDCNLFSGALNENGYGVVWTDGKPKKAHRAAWEAAYGPIPAGKLVLHSCDTRACVNLDHLRLGTHRENTADMDARGRRVNHPPRKLTVAQVRQIRAWRDVGWSLAALAEAYGVTVIAIHSVVTRKTWKHVR